MSSSTAAKITVPLLDLKAQYATIREEIRAAVDGVFERQYFIMGAEVKAFEQEVSNFLGVEHAIGCASGSDALMLALMALGIGQGDEVIVPTYSFFATAGSVARLVARPVFVDINDDDFNIDCELIADKISAKTKAIMPVHLFGQCADMSALSEISTQTGIPIIEDAAQAISATYQGRQAGTLSPIGCFSFFPSKNLGGAGDGGMVVTDDAELAQKLRMLREHGSRKKYYYEIVGVNSRLDELQAAVLRVKLRYLNDWSSARAHNADRYDNLFGEFGLDDFVRVPARLEDRGHIFNQYVIRVNERDRLMAYLKEQGIGTEVYYPLSLHQQICFDGLTEEALPVAELASQTTLALPIYPELSESQQQAVVERIAEFYRGQL